MLLKGKPQEPTTVSREANPPKGPRAKPHRTQGG